MSKIGQKPVEILPGATVTVVDRAVNIKGAKVVLSVDIPKGIKVAVDNNTVNISRENDSISAKSLHGTVRSLISNAVIGVTKGWEKKMEVVGTGYGVVIKDGNAVLKVGYSHMVTIPKTDHISFQTEGQNILLIQGPSKEEVGQVAHKVRCIKPPDPYKGKGVRYLGEQIKLKPGKKAKTA